MTTSGQLLIFHQERSKDQAYGTSSFGFSSCVKGMS